jgi:PAS domain S-box-containing protein
MTTGGHDTAAPLDPEGASQPGTPGSAALQEEVLRLRQENEDLKIALLTISEHGDFIEAQLHNTNQRLATEVAERQQAQATLQDILEKVSRDKADLEIMLQATAEHGDTVEYQLYTQAVETMRHSEALFRAIAESTPVLMILSQQPDGQITYANSVSTERLAGQGQALEGRCLRDFLYDPADAERWQNLLDTEGKVLDYEVRLRDYRGQSLWVSASIHPIVLGEVTTFLTTFYDISDRKRAQLLLQASEDTLRQQAQVLEERVQERTAALSEAEAKYRDIFENAAQGIFQITPQGQYLQANHALVQLLGYSSAADLMANLTDTRQQLYVQPQRWLEMMAYIKRFGHLTDFESEVYRKDGSSLWISESIRPVQDGDGKLLYYEGSVWDITQRKQTEAALRLQRQMADRLLLNVLPQPIAQRLKQGQKNIADHYDDVAVLFADIVDFTRLSSEVEPERLVSLLNDIFSAFDKLLDYYHLEKIKTIGDAYMVAGGLPIPQADPLGAIADMALAMRDALQPFQVSGHSIQLRVGIHAGPVIAGVIGARKFIYDLWGDTVNIASRMESQGEPSRIQVTDWVYQRLHKRYRFEHRGQITVKGKGQVDTYWLLGSKVDA